MVAFPSRVRRGVPLFSRFGSFRVRFVSCRLFWPLSIKAWTGEEVIEFKLAISYAFAAHPISTTMDEVITAVKAIVNTITKKPNLLNRLLRNGWFGLILGFSDKFITYAVNCLYKSGIIGSFT